jgi:hypothetical protein
MTADRMVDDTTAPVSVGVLGGDWRAHVTPWGAMRMWDAGGTLDWWVAADDRWHDPSREPTVRQARLDGTPVVETRLRIPGGDAVHRVYAVADGGGYTVVEIENDSPLPIAVAFDGMPLLSPRPPTDMPIAGIELPAGTVAYPIGHHATLVVVIAHGSPGTASLPAVLPTRQQVAHGWLAVCERASRLLVPDSATNAAVVAARCELLLAGPSAATRHPVDFLLDVGELVRMGTMAEPWIPEVSDAVTALASHRDDPLLAAAVDAAERVCLAAREARAVRDLALIRLRLLPGERARAEEQPRGARLVTAAERMIADGDDLLPAGLPESWLGQNFEVHGVPTSPRSRVSLAVRWHGARPAVLWECHGAPVRLRATAMAPEWSSGAMTGEALWPSPRGAAAAIDDSVSFG